MRHTDCTVEENAVLGIDILDGRAEEGFVDSRSFSQIDPLECETVDCMASKLEDGQWSTAQLTVALVSDLQTGPVRA